MTILLTNDDGIESPGIKALESSLSDNHDIWIAAPERERSGASHSITLNEPVKFQLVAERKALCGGTPADCVLFALHGALKIKPDIIISGINLGPNVGTDIIYSGTVAAARQAALMGFPSVAISLAQYQSPFYFENCCRFIKNNLELFVSRWRDDHFLNINVPNTGEQDLDVQITHPSRRIYNDHLVSLEGRGGKIYYFLQGPVPDAHPEKGTDWDALGENRISCSPLPLHPENRTIYALYTETDFR